MALQYILLIVLLTLSVIYGATETKSVRAQPTVRLMNAARGEVLMPVVGLGTFGYGRPDGSRGEYWGPEQGHNATIAWLKVGGRRLDSSDNYASQPGIGTGWKASGVPRSEIFITSKVDANGYNETLTAFDGVLQALQTDYVDLFLIHWPGNFRSGPNDPSCKKGQHTWAECRIQTWRALETIFNQQKVRYFSCLFLFEILCFRLVLSV